jgi:hypothetical protein
MSRAIPLPPTWAFEACYRANFTSPSVSYICRLEIIKRPNVTKFVAVQVKVLHVGEMGKMKTIYVMTTLIKHTKISKF